MEDNVVRIINGIDELALKAYKAIEYLATPKKDRYSSAEIASFLIEKAHFDTSRQAVDYVLQKNKGMCNKNKDGWKLMEKGRDELAKVIQKKKIQFITANQPFSAKNNIKEILDDKYKEVSICDPYVDIGTLDVIFRNFKKAASIRLLTARLDNKPPGIIKRQLAHINSEGFNVEIKIYNCSELHDRYIIDEKHFWLSGNSLNFLGNKESFIVLLGEDVRQSMLAMFNGRWKVSTPI